MKSLKLKMLLVLLPIILFALAVISGIGYFFARQVILKNVDEILLETAHSSANKIEGWLNVQLQIVNSNKTTLEKVSLSSSDEISYLSTVLKSNPNFSDIYIGTKDGVMIDGSGWAPPADYDPRQRDWYTLGNTAQTATFTDSYVDMITNKLVVSSCVLLNDTSGNFRGVLACDISLENITEFIKQISYGETGYAYLVNNKDGTILAHQDDSNINKKLSELEGSGLNELQSKISSGKSESSAYTINGKKIIAYFAPIPGTEWSVVTAVNEQEILKSLNQLLINILITFVFALLLIGFAIERATHQIVKPIHSLDSSIRIIAGGDFTQEIPKNNLLRKDEIGIISVGIQQMQEALRNLINQVKTESRYIEDDVEQVVGNVDILYDNIGDVSATTEELSAGMEETAASSEEMSATAQEIEHTAQQIAARSQEGATEAEEINRRANQTKDNVIASTLKAKEALSTTQQNLKDALNATKVVKEIDILSDSIMQITAQTNLLALNASIEAARAGEAGKGFSVVAEEIRVLAEQSKNAVLKIQETTSRVTGSVDRLSECAQDVLSYISTDVVNDYAVLLEVAEHYSKDAKYVDELVSEFYSSSSVLLSAIQNIISAIGEVATAANEGAQGTTDIALRISDTTQKASEVQEIVAKTKKSTYRLTEEIAKFRV